MSLEQLVVQIANNQNGFWTFILMFVRFQALMMLLPGIGEGQRGLLIRMPAVLLLAAVSMATSPLATLPEDWGGVIVSITGEFLLGSLIGMIPIMLISAVQTAGHLASTSMGLGASQLIDPTLGISVTDLSRLYSDLTVIMFLLLGGHHVMIYGVAGLGGTIVPGTFLWNATTTQYLIDQSAAIFKLGFILSSPVIAALLLTQFVMGLISRAVPTVNIFIVSFPVTIGIGLVLSILALPEVMNVLKNEMTSMESGVEVISRGATRLTPSPTPRPTSF